MLQSENEAFNESKFDWKLLNKTLIENNFPLNKKIEKAKCLKFNLIDNLVLLSTRRSVLSEEFLNFDQLHVGQVVKCKVIGKAEILFY
jgi:hypothetical protein